MVVIALCFVQLLFLLIKTLHAFFYLCEPEFDSPLFKGAGKLFELFQVTRFLGMSGHRVHRTDAALHDLLPLVEK